VTCAADARLRFDFGEVNAETGEMTQQDKPLDPGLYLVATPIGSARDITLRALDILGAADLIAAEDTRTARKLMDIHGIALKGRPMLAYHDHSGRDVRARIARAIEDGKSVAYVSEAGTPLVADPGFALVRDLAEDGHPITAAPGASAVTAAIALAGLPTDRFLFAGFLPTKPGARTSVLQELGRVQATLIFYEAPKRMERALDAMITTWGPDRRAAVCRELTKRFEQVMRGTLGELRDSLGSDIPLKGEFVIVVAPPEAQEVSEADLDTALIEALKTATVKDAAKAVATQFSQPKSEIYARALALKED